jgi:UTP--glucose-1-phosphate uridylyltransferase
VLPHAVAKGGAGRPGPAAATDVTSLTAEQLAFLQRYGFDQELFARWQRDIKSGALSTAGNAVEAPLHAPEPGDIAELRRNETGDLERLEEVGAAAIRRGELGVVVLNGGMATRFGGVVKGTVDVLGDGRSFLALKVEDVRRAQEAHGGRIHLFVMNSFATDQATREHFAAARQFGLDEDQVHHFTQFVAPRLTTKGEVFRDRKGEISPYGPGHGDFAPAFRASGCLARFLAAGGTTLLVSNVDNLGARVSPAILGFHLDAGAEVTVEVAPKWPGDVGGSPYRVGDRLQLVEQIRYAEDFDPDIVDVFNTNTFHFAAAALDRDFDLGWYYVEKKVGNAKVVQVERLIGEMTRFLHARFLKVKRTGTETRFFPVKTPEDLEAGRDEIAAMYAT